MEKKFFRVIGESNSTMVFSSNTFHFSYERQVRRELVISKLGKGNAVVGFVVDKGHINGYERHIIYDNGVIVVANERTKRVITIMVARVGQITRYWNNQGKQIPREMEYLIKIARENEYKGYNYL